MFSHPGHFGKSGIRHLHLKKNQYFLPTINVDKLWTLLTEQAYTGAKELALKEGEKAKAVVIDCNKAVYIYIYIYNRDITRFLVKVNYQKFP